MKELKTLDGKGSPVKLTHKVLENVNVFALASGIGAGEYGTELGVWNLYYTIGNQNPILKFKKVYHHNSKTSQFNAVPSILPTFIDAIIDISYLHRNHEHSKYLFLTGDHSNAIAVWAGLINAINDDFGLIWIDNHLDSHSPTSSISKNVHGMAAATLMGAGFAELTKLINVKIKPQNICFIGTGSYEPAELEFLQANNVKIFFAKDITKDNINEIFAQAVEHVSKNTKKFGVSLDIDAFDKKYTPGAGCNTHNNLNPEWFYNSLAKLSQHDKFIGLEVTEYNPLKDEAQKTLSVIKNIINNVFKSGI